MRFDLDVRIDRPVADVFAYVTDVRNVPEWQESAVSAEWIEDGKRFRERRTFLGRTYAEGKKITWRDGFRALWVLVRVRIR